MIQNALVKQFSSQNLLITFLISILKILNLSLKTLIKFFKPELHNFCRVAIIINNIKINAL